MIILYLVLALIGAYLIGSIPTAVWIGKVWYGIDVREHGSGNAGATNTFRILGKKAGIPVLLIDILKGYSATSLIIFLPFIIPKSPEFVYMEIGLGITAVVGHIYPIFAGFRGGKGIATLFGMTLALHAPAAMLCLLIFLIVLIISHYVSLSSIIASISYPLFFAFLFPSASRSLIYFGILVCFLVLYTHRKNITRLVSGNESKVYLFGKHN